MGLEITRGAKRTGQIAVIYGQEGVGKTKLASMMPNPVYLDLEDSTKRMDVARLPKPTSLPNLLQITNEFQKDPMGFKTLVVDTADWAEVLFIQNVLATTGKGALGGQDDFGHSFGMLETLWGKWLDALTMISECGVHVVVLAHSKIRKQELPEEFGAFDHYELKLEKKTSAKLKEWAENLFFIRYNTIVVVDAKTKTKKASGDDRVICTAHHACWDAKNRQGLPAEIRYEDGVFPEELRAMFAPLSGASYATPQAAPPVQQPAPDSAPAAQSNSVTAELAQLRDLMQQSGIEVSELQAAMAARGWFPPNMPLENLPLDFVRDKLVAQWTKVEAVIMKGRANVAA